MFHISHEINGRNLDEYTKREHAAFLITNKRGNYLSLGDENISHTQGLFFFDNKNWDMFKTIESIKINHKMIGIKNNFFNVQRVYEKGAKETFNLFNNSMVYSVTKYEGDIVLSLDFRNMFDFDDRGRIYSVFQEDELLIIKYEKFSDNSLSNLEKVRYLAIKGIDDYELINNWVKKNYAYDARRNSRSELFVYEALKIKCNNHLNLIFSFSEDKNIAIAHARKIFNNKDYFINSLKNYVNHSFSSEDLALDAAMKSLDDMVVSLDREERSVGIFAGLPWFNHLWARDELICLKALMLQEKYYLVKSILFKYLERIGDDGLIPNRLPSSNIKSMDAIGWFFFRLKEYIDILVSKKILNDYISVADLVEIKKALQKSLHRMVHDYSKNGLIISNIQETWMDTAKANRSGACIEIQAMFLSMVDLHNNIAKLTKTKQIFKGFEKEYKTIIRNKFYENSILKDCVFGNSETRPNIFIAYYLYPDLLSKREWRNAFDNALKELWLGWGGLSSISQISPVFKLSYTGENNESYHNGDSWFFVNNIAAIAMKRLDSRYYADKIKSIKHASREDLLFSGFIGCCSELSSAKHLRSEGCLSQAWSAATFIELWMEK